MIIERKIKGVEVDVDINEGNEIYLPEHISETIKSDGIEGIIDAIYLAAECKHLPLSVFIELTDHCNFGCPFCYINEAGKEHHSLPDFKRLKPVLDFLINNGLLYCTLSGGECMIHPDFKEIYAYLKTNGVLVSVFTNGYLVDDDTITLFEKYKPFKVEISIYGIDDATYRCSVDNPHIISQRIFDNIIRIRELGIDVTCKTPITSLTEQSFPLIQKWCEENSIPFYSGYELQDTYNGTSRSQYLASEKIRKEMRDKSDVAFFNDPQMLELANASPKKKQAFDCAAGKTELFISAKYNLLPCMKAIGINGWSYDISILGIEQAYEYLLKKIFEVKYKPLKYCKGCSHHKVCQECYFTQFDYQNIENHRVEYCNSLSDFCKKGIES